MSHMSEQAAWAEAEFGQARLKDVRRVERLMAIATRVASTPAGKVTEVFTEGADRQATYKFLSNPKVDTAAIRKAAHVAGARRCAEEPFAFVPIDQSSLTITDMLCAKQLGSVGYGANKSRGIQVMTALVVSPDGTPQGLAGQCYWSRQARQKTPERQKAWDRRKKPTKDKETQYWIDGLDQAKAAFADGAPNARCWPQLDRGGDNWPVLQHALELDVWITVRASHDRRLVVQPGDRRRRYLRETVEQQDPLGDFLLEVPPGPHRTARTATMQVRAVAVTLDLKDHRTSRHHSVPMWAVHTRELERPPSGEARIEWLLLTRYPVHDLVDAQTVVFGYSMRWRIEGFHYAWKSGGCQIEDTQLGDFDTIVRWASILSSVAVRIQRLMYLSRHQPDLPATVELTQAEIDAVIFVREPNGYQLGDVPTIGQVVEWIAREGGYTGKSSGGPPGARVIARGLDRLAAVIRKFSRATDGGKEIG